jgi:hypothetical protein
VVLSIDHFAIGAKHIYEGAIRLRDETGLESYDGGFFPGMGVAQRPVPLGRHTYIEIESVIEKDMARDHFFGRWFDDVLTAADGCFMGWVIKVGTMDEMRELAARFGTEIKPIPKTGGMAAWGRTLPSGYRHGTPIMTPDAANHPWPRGLPGFIYWPDLDDMPDTIPEAKAVVHRGPIPDGIAWMELGDEALTREFIGPGSYDMDLRFIDAPAGLYAVGINSDQGEIVIRRDPVPLELAADFTP